MFQIISFILMLQCLQNVIAILIWVKPTTLNYEAKIACYKPSEVRRVFGAASLNRELVTIGRAVKMGNRRHAGPLCTNIRQNLRECDQKDPNAFIQITDSLSREMKQFEYEKSELYERKSPFVIGFNIEPSATKIFHAQPSSPIAKEILIGCFNFAGSYQNFNFASAYNKNSNRSISIPIYEPELISECTDGNIYISCELASNYINMGIPQHLFLQYNEFSYDILSRTIEVEVNASTGQNEISNSEPVEVGVNASTGQNEISNSEPVEVGVNASTGQNEISNSEPVEVGVNASTGQNEVSTSSVQPGDVHGISPTNNHLPSTDSEEKFNLPPCAICFDKPREITFIPCGHLASCRQCADIIKNFCPMCRGEIEGKQLTYL